MENRNGLEEARLISFYVLKAGGFKIRRLTQVIRFPWDKREPLVKGFQEWDSPEMKAWDEEADRALAVLNPEAYARYMEGKKAREEAATIERMTNEDDMTIKAQIDF